MRIAHVVSYFQPEFGYEEYYSAREQAAMGHDVHVITSDRIFPFNDVEKMLSDIGSEYRSRSRPRGIERMEGFEVHRLKTRFEILFDLIFYGGIAEELKRIRPDVVHAHGLWQWGSYKSAKLKEKLGYKLVVDEHAYSTTYDQNKTLRNFLLDKEYRILRAPFARYVIKRADEIVAICKETQDFLGSFYKLKDVHLIPMGIDQRRFDLDPDGGKKMRAQLGVEDGYLLITAGRLDRAKGLEHFIKGVGMLDRDDVELVIVGRGDESYLEELKGMAGEKVQFLGFRRPEDLSKLYSAADIGLWGKASITIREAMGCSLPLILFNKPNMKDLLKWKNGLFVEPDPVKVRDAVNTLVDDEELRKKMGKASRKGVEEELSVRVEAKKLLDVYS